MEYVSATIALIGQVAGVKVGQRTKRTDGETTVVPKFASAHDLRRSFGARWAPRVMPKVLQELLRHESIETTMAYYVGRNAEETADAVWEASERVSVSVSIGPEATENENGPDAVSTEAAKVSAKLGN